MVTYQSHFCFSDIIWGTFEDAGMSNVILALFSFWISPCCLGRLWQSLFVIWKRFDLLPTTLKL